MEFHELPDHARVWIYQSNRKLTDVEVFQIKQQASDFLANWNTHGTPLKAGIELLHALFLVIMVDEAHAAASGCSIDKSVAFVKRMEQMFNINFMDRMQVAYEHEGQVETVHLHQMKTSLQSKGLSENTTVFNNLVSSKSDFDSQWKAPLKDSWHFRFWN
jgi:hypothetical protein